MAMRMPSFTRTKPEAPGVHAEPLWSFRPQSDREAGDAVTSNFMLHWFPAKISKASMAWSYSFWLGTISAALFFLLILSGLPLLFLYVPSVERAYQSVKDIEFVITFGSWIRAVHRIAAHLMVIAVALHLVRVFLTGAYKNGVGRGQRREINWVIGVVMFLTHAVPVVHRLPAAVGSAGVLGGDRRHQHRVVHPVDRPAGARAADRRPQHRPGDAHPLLRAAHRVPAGAAGRALRVSHVARAQGRRAGPRRPRGRARAAADHRGGADQDLHAARRGARHGADRDRAHARSAPTRRSMRCPIWCGGRPSPRSAPSRSSASCRCSSPRRSKSRPTRWSRRIRRRRRGTSCGSRKSSPTPPSRLRCSR